MKLWNERYRSCATSLRYVRTMPRSSAVQRAPSSPCSPQAYSAVLEPSGAQTLVDRLLRLIRYVEKLSVVMVVSPKARTVCQRTSAERRPTGDLRKRGCSSESRLCRRLSGSAPKQYRSGRNHSGRTDRGPYPTRRRRCGPAMALRYHGTADYATAPINVIALRRSAADLFRRPPFDRDSIWLR